jgi:hypothetical protein
MERIYILTALFILFAILGLFILRPQRQKESPTMEYELLMAILETTIQREIKVKMDDYTLRGVKFPSDYMEEVREVCQRIVRGISPFMWEELEFFHPRKYILDKINKDVQQFFITFIRENKPITR